MTTTSRTDQWSPSRIEKSGGILIWQATNSRIGTITKVENQPIFDFSANDGSDILISVSSPDGFSGLTIFDLRDRFHGVSVNGIPSQMLIKEIDLSPAYNLVELSTQYNRLKNLDILDCTQLENLNVRGSGQLSGGLDLSNNPLLSYITADVTALPAIDFSQNPLLNYVSLYQAKLTSEVMDQIIIDLDKHGLSDGFLELRNQATGDQLTTTSLSSYNSLKLKGWSIDVAPPPAPNEKQIILTTSSKSSIWSPALVVNSTSTLKWVVSGGITIPEIINDDPIIDLSNNVGVGSITITSAEGFAGLSALDFWVGPDGGEITAIDISNALSLKSLNLRYNKLSTLDISQNRALETLIIRGNLQLNNKGLNTSNNIKLSYLQIDGTGINAIDLSNNLYLTDVILNNAFLTSTALDKVFIDLDSHGLKNGTLSVANQRTAQTITSAAYISYNNLKTKGWSIDVPAPAAPSPPGIMITQYYEGNSDSKWIEVVNRSQSVIPSGTYFLGMYDQDEISNIDKKAPSSGRIVSIPSLNPGQLILFGKMLTANTLPLASNLGISLNDVIEIPNFDFDGDDIILISSRSDANCYAYRADIVGTVPSTSWGSDISYIRGGNSSEVPEKDFNAEHWIPLNLKTDVDIADKNTNISLGNQVIGKTTWNGTNWDKSVPDKTRDVDINSEYDAQIGNIHGYNLFVKKDANLAFDKGTTNSVIIEGNLTIEGTFNIGDKESLVMTNDGAIITGTITKFESSNIRNNNHDITYWSSPVSNETIGSVFTGVTPSRIFYYDQSKTSATDPKDPTYWNTWVIPRSTDLIIPGYGYAAEGIAGTTGIHNIVFSGSPNNGVVKVKIRKINDGNPDNDWNLVGNPYPSAINIDHFFLLNKEIISPEIYLWTHTSPISGGDSGDFSLTDYATYNLEGGVGVVSGLDPTFNIGSGQGFFVRGLEGSIDSLRFNNSLRIPDLNNQFFKSEKNKNKPGIVQSSDRDRIWLNLTSDNGGFNQILIGFSEFSTIGVDLGHDALRKRSDNLLSFYSNINDKKYVIQGLGPFSEENSEVILGFDIKVAPRTLRISIEKIEGKLGDSKIYLVDNLLNKTHDLKKGSYIFEQKEIGENLNRFTLKFTKSNAGGNNKKLKEEIFVVSSQEDYLKVRSNKVVRTIKVYDLYERLLINESPASESFYLKTSKIKRGTIIFIESIFEDGTVFRKKTIKL